MANENTAQNQEVKTATPPPPPPGSMKINVGEIAMRAEVNGASFGFDFNLGARVSVPQGNWRVRLIDPSTSTLVHDQMMSGATIASKKRYFIPWRIEIMDDKGHLLFVHDYNAKGKKILLKNVSDALGDTIAWIPYAREFKKKHDCEIYYAMNPAIANLLKHDYPDMNFIGPDDRPPGIYASYYLGCFSPCHDRECQPSSWHTLGLQRNVASILDLPRVEIRPTITPTNKERLIKEPYVCIAAQASAQAKYWNNPVGWMDLNKFLLSQGYRVICIDKERAYGTGYNPNRIPWGSEDFTGNYTLEDRVNMLQYADFFVGLGSGLSWLAWAVGLPVVLISGFSLPEMEFANPYRVINYNVCTGCFNDDAFDFEHGNFFWCPRNKDDKDRQFECTRGITSNQVIETVKRLMKDYKFNPQKHVADGKNKQKGK